MSGLRIVLSLLTTLAVVETPARAADVVSDAALTSLAGRGDIVLGEAAAIDTGWFDKRSITVRLKALKWIAGGGKNPGAEIKVVGYLAGMTVGRRYLVKLRNE